MIMKKFLISLILSLLLTSVALARSTGCKEGNCENGYGKWVYTDNSEWSGIGILTFPDGSNYEGEWAKGFMNGKGTFTWSDGTQKTGTWKNGELQE